MPDIGEDRDQVVLIRERTHSIEKDRLQGQLQPEVAQVSRRVVARVALLEEDARRGEVVATVLQQVGGCVAVGRSVSLCLLRLLRCQVRLTIVAFSGGA